MQWPLGLPVPSPSQHPSPLKPRAGNISPGSGDTSAAPGERLTFPAKRVENEGDAGLAVPFIGLIKIALAWQAAGGGTGVSGAARTTSRRAVLSPRVPSPLHTCHGLCIYSGQILTQQGRKASRACRGRGHWEPPRVAPEPLLMGLIRASSPGNSLHKEQRGREGKRCSLNLPWNNTSCRFPPTCLSLFAAPGLAEW